jgi:hypothetical protein
MSRPNSLSFQQVQQLGGGFGTLNAKMDTLTVEIAKLQPRPGPSVCVRLRSYVYERTQLLISAKKSAFDDHVAVFQKDLDLQAEVLSCLVEHGALKDHLRQTLCMRLDRWGPTDRFKLCYEIIDCLRRVDIALDSSAAHVAQR